MIANTRQSYKHADSNIFSLFVLVIFYYHMTCISKYGNHLSNSGTKLFQMIKKKLSA